MCLFVMDTTKNKFHLDSVDSISKFQEAVCKITSYGFGGRGRGGMAVS